MSRTPSSRPGENPKQPALSQPPASKPALSQPATSPPALSQPGPSSSPANSGSPGTSASAGGGPGSMPPRGFERRPAQPTMHPRRVVGGAKLTTRGLKADESGAAPAPSVHWSWASARWMRIAEQFAPGEQLAEGLEYAKIGQTRQLDLGAGTIGARVQGRMPQAYKVLLRLPTFAPEQWDAITGAMSGQAKYSASLLGGELPANIEDLFAPVGLNLFPLDLADLSVSCECDIFRRRSGGEAAVPTVSVASIAAGSAAKGRASATPSSPTAGGKGLSGGKPGKKGEAAPSIKLCKHICCAMYLVAERLAQQPLLIFALRGLPEADLLERLRTQRAIAGLQRTGGSAAPVYTPHLPISSRMDESLEESVQDFWGSPGGAELDGLDMPIEPPAVTHPLLRRMGGSPMAGAKFPLVGLLATCYDVISEKVIQEAAGVEDVAHAETEGD